MLRISNYKLIVLSVFMSLHLICAISFCDESIVNNATSHQESDSSVERHLRQMQKHFESLHGFSVKGKFVSELQVNEKIHHSEKELIIKFRRPNRMFVVSNDKVRFGCDGDTMKLVTVGQKAYVEQPAPKDFRALDKVDVFQNMTGSSMSSLFAPLFFAENLYDSLLKDTKRAEYHEIDNGKVHCLRLHREDGIWELWLPDRASTPERLRIQLFPRRFAVNGKDANSISIKSTLTLRFSDWKKNPQLIDSDFRIDTPPDGKAFASISDSNKASVSQKPDPLLGQRPPRLVLSTLDGEKVDLRQHVDKEIVVINFLSTRSAISRWTLPILARIHNSFRDKGIVFYGIAVREDAEGLRKYLDKTKLDFGTIVLDQDGKVAEGYGLSGLPQSFIIDKQGRIHVALKGVSNDLEKRLTSELNSVINGEKLAGKTTKRRPEPNTRMQLGE